jgi:hypothetical protein
MNKKQLIVAWVLAVMIFLEWLLVILYNYKIIQHHFPEYILDSGVPTLSPLHNCIFLSIPQLVFGLLLIYTLKDKKK